MEGRRGGEWPEWEDILVPKKKKNTVGSGVRGGEDIGGEDIREEGCKLDKLFVSYSCLTYKTFEFNLKLIESSLRLSSSSNLLSRV